MKVFDLFNKKKYLIAAIAVSIIALFLGFFVKSFAVSILCSSIIYLCIFLLPIQYGFGLVLLLVPNVGVFDNSGFKYVFNFALVAFLLRVLIDCYLKKELFNKKVLLFAIALVGLILYDFLNSLLSHTFSIQYLANLNIWVTWIIFFLLVTTKDLSNYKKIYFILFAAGFVISFGLGIISPLKSWGFKWPDKYRFVGLVRDPNYFGVLAMLIIITSPFILRGWYRYFLIIPTAVLGYLSLSKMFILVFLLYFICLTMYDVFFNKTTERYLIFNGFVLISSILAISLVLITTDALTQIQEFLRTRYIDFKHFDIDAITTGRTRLWRQYFGKFFENPHNFLLGRTLSYPEYYKIPYHETNVNPVVHNTYFDVLLTFGFVGLPIYGFLWYHTIKNRKTKFDVSFNSISSLSALLLMIFGLSYLSADCLMIFFAYMFVFNSKVQRKEVVVQKDKIKVLQIVNSLSNANGVASLLVNYYKGLLEHDYKDVQVDFLIQQSSYSGNFKCLKSLNAKIHVIQRPTFRTFFKSRKAYKKLLADNSYDIVHCHLSNTAFFYLGIAEKNGVKHRIIHSHASKWGDSFKKRCLNFVLSQQGLFYATDRFACSYKAGKFLFKKLDFYILPNAVEPLKYSFNKENRNKIRKQLNVNDSTFVVGNIGRLTPQKNQKFLIDILCDLVLVRKLDAVLVILGNGPLYDELLTYSSERNVVDRVKVLGDVTNTEEFYSAFDVFALPSLYEGLPVVGIEAQFNSLPMVVSENVTKEMVFSNSISYVDGYDVQKWADELLKLERNNFVLEHEKANQYDISFAATVLRNEYLKIAEIPNNLTKKVGIMTMHRVINFGSFLQAYSLKKVLESKNAEVTFVDYNHGPIIEFNQNGTNNKKSQILRFIKKFKIKRLVDYKLMRMRYSDTLAWYLDVDKHRTYNPSLDCLVVGSDEVFNCFQGNPNIGYTLDLFGKNQTNSKRIISYAASFGNTNIEKLEKANKKNEIADCLKNFNALSVRDENSLDVIKTLTNRDDVSLNVDPVFLSDFENELMDNKVKTGKKKYVAVYAYSGRISEEEGRLIQTFAKKNNLKVICVGYPQCFGKFVTGNPFEIVNYLVNSSFVITDTFHGAVFSIKYNLNFATVVRSDNDLSTGRGNKEKLSFLLKQFGLLDRQLESFESIQKLYDTSIDFNRVNMIVNQEKEKSLSYLDREVFGDGNE